MRRWCICLLTNLFVCLSAYSQQTVSPQPPIKLPLINLTLPNAKTSFNGVNTSGVKFYNAPLTVIPANYYSSTLGFFCRKEIQMEKAIKFPVKIRLGSVAYTDKMEGKGAGVLLPAGKR